MMITAKTAAASSWSESKRFKTGAFPTVMSKRASGSEARRLLMAGN
jgi:hypothetical protein